MSSNSVVDDSKRVGGVGGPLLMSKSGLDHHRCPRRPTPKIPSLFGTHFGIMLAHLLFCWGMLLIIVFLSSMVDWFVDLGDLLTPFFDMCLNVSALLVLVRFCKSSIRKFVLHSLCGINLNTVRAFVVGSRRKTCPNEAPMGEIGKNKYAMFGHCWGYFYGKYV